MKLKTATLLAGIGTGLEAALQIYFFVSFYIIERGEYATFQGGAYSFIEVLIKISLFIFFVVFYNKQNNKSWKD